MSFADTIAIQRVPDHSQVFGFRPMDTTRQLKRYIPLDDHLVHILAHYKI